MIKKYLLKIITPLVMFAFALAYYIEILGKKASAGVFIRPIFWGMAVLFVIILLMDWRDVKESADEEKKEEKAESETENKKISPDLMRTIICVVGSVVYIFAQKYLGFLISTTIFLFAMFCWLKANNKILTFILAALIAFGMYALFNIGLKVPLPTGFLGFI